LVKLLEKCGIYLSNMANKGKGKKMGQFLFPPLLKYIILNLMLRKTSAGKFDWQFRISDLKVSIKARTNLAQNLTN